MLGASAVYLASRIARSTLAVEISHWHAQLLGRVGEMAFHLIATCAVPQ